MIGRPFPYPGCRSNLSRRLEVGRRDVDERAALRAPGQQGAPEGTDPAADVEHGRAGREPLEPRDDLSLPTVKPVTPVGAEFLTHEPPSEQLVEAVGVATVHGRQHRA